MKIDIGSKSKRDSISCLACGGTALKALRRYKSATPSGKALFERRYLFHCNDCGLTQVYPLPTSSDLMQYYSFDYRSGGKFGSALANLELFPEDNSSSFFRGESISELVVNHMSSDKFGRGEGEPKLLDIGAGFGHILYSLSTRYPNAKLFTVEISDVGVKHLCSLNIEVFEEPVETILPKLAQEFDIIILSRMLEHFLDLKTMLSEVRKHIRKDGLLYIEVPNCPPDFLKGGN